MATPDYNVDLENNPELKAVRTEENGEIAKSDATYDSMVAQSDAFYNKQVANVANWENTQKKLQNEQTDFAIEQINQQKDQAQKDYIKEQSGAYVDWQKQSNQYGANAEQMAAGGMQNTGYAESSQVSMYNTYQNRVAMAREAYSRAVLNYDNAIKDARLQNNARLAQIAFESLQKQLELSLAGFQYKNQLISEKADRQLQIKSLYQTKWATVLDQINTENAMAEEVRQYNASHELQERAIALDEAQFAWQKEQAAKASSGSSGSKSKGTTIKKTSAGGSNIRQGKDAINEVNISDKEKGSNKLKVDMDSVIGLGYGPISEAKLNALVEQGLVKETVKDGKLVFEKTTGVPTTAAGKKVDWFKNKSKKD